MPEVSECFVSRAMYRQLKDAAERIATMPDPVDLTSHDMVDGRQFDSVEVEGGSLLFSAEAGHCWASVSIREFIQWVRENRPELLVNQ